MSLAAEKRWKEALALSDSLDTAINATRPSDPFARSAFHLLRGDWFLAMGDTAGAEQEWRWHENSDIVGWPTGFPQAGEIDGMLGVEAAFVHARSVGLLLGTQYVLGQRRPLVRVAGLLGRQHDPSLEAAVSRRLGSLGSRQSATDDQQSARGCHVRLQCD